MSRDRHITLDDESIQRIESKQDMSILSPKTNDEKFDSFRTQTVVSESLLSHPDFASELSERSSQMQKSFGGSKNVFMNALQG